MIRLRPDPDKRRLRIEARRKIKGWVEIAQRSTEMREGDGRIHLLVYCADWYKPIGVNGYHGRWYRTWKQALDTLLSDHRFRVEP